MGRVKLQIKKLETPVNKQVTYSKRRFGLQKKANELSILCDVDIALILFSPAGKLSWTVGHKSSLEQVIMKFANLSPQERAKRKLEGLEQLKRVFKKHDHEVNIEDYIKPSTSSVNVEELHQQLQMLHQQLYHIQQGLSSYENFNTIEEGEEVERILKERLLTVHTQKQLIESNEQFVSFNHGFRTQFYQPEALSNSGTLEENMQGSWIPDQAQQNILANIFSQREADNGAACSSSFPDCMMQLAKPIECTEDQAKYKMHCHLADVFRSHEYDQTNEPQKQQDLKMELDASTSEFAASGGAASLTSNIEHTGKGLWYPSSNATANNEVMNIVPNRYQFPEACYLTYLAPFEVHTH